MKNAAKILGVLILVPTAILAGYITAGVILLKRIDYEMTGYSLKGINKGILSLILELKIINPSFIKVGIDKYDLTVSINNIPVSKLSSKIPILIQANDFTEISIPVDVDIEKSFGVLKSREIIGYFIAQQYDKITIFVRGDFGATVMKIPISTKIDEKWTLKEISEIMST